jgi:salicylate hydroxylase
MLYEASLALGVRFLFDSEVADVAPDSTKVTLRGGGALQGDVVVIADGYNSSVRPLAMGGSEYVAGDEKSLFVTFEVPIDVIRLDKELASLAEPSTVRIPLVAACAVLLTSLL